MDLAKLHHTSPSLDYLWSQSPMPLLPLPRRCNQHPQPSQPTHPDLASEPLWSLPLSICKSRHPYPKYLRQSHQCDQQNQQEMQPAYIYTHLIRSLTHALTPAAQRRILWLGRQVGRQAIQFCQAVYFSTVLNKRRKEKPQRRNETGIVVMR